MSVFSNVGNAIFNKHDFGSQLILGMAQLVAHASLFFVLLSFSPKGFLVSLFIYFLMTSVGVSMTAHRFLAHRSFYMPRYFEVFGSIFFSLSLQGSTIAWVAMHREHHRHADSAGDPHAPTGKIFKTHFLSMFYTPKIKYATTLMRDSFHSKIHRYYWPLNIGYSVLLFALFGINGPIYGHLFPAFLCWQAIGTVKTFAHLFGYRNFTTKDKSFNLPILGYLTFGEGWHNNHHARPGKYCFSYHRHEIDISSLLIKVGIKLGGFGKVWNGKH